MTRLSPAAALLLCLAACGDPLAPLPTDGPPRTLTYDAGGFFATSTGVRVVGDTVVLTSQRYDRTGLVVTESRRVPAPDEWRAFWAAVGDAGVRRWPQKCANSTVQDGGGYDFVLAWDGGRRTGSYTNAAPTRAGRCSNDYFDDSMRFQRAVLGVAGASVLRDR